MNRRFVELPAKLGDAVQFLSAEMCGGFGAPEAGELELKSGIPDRNDFASRSANIERIE